VPFIETELNLTPQQLSIFIEALQYIIPCQSRFTRKTINENVQTELEKISAPIKKCLGDNEMSITDQRATQAFLELERIIYKLYSKPLPRRLYRRAHREYKIVRSIQDFLRTHPDIILRPIDKGKGFYIGKKTTLELKTQEYMDRTEAYQEITNDHSPLADSLHAVQTQLDYLVKQKAITMKRCNTLLPDLNKLELAHFYTLPKVHKVYYIVFFFFFFFFHSLFL
jgi:hypothetical protein